MNSIELSLTVGSAATLMSAVPAVFTAWFLERTRSRFRPLVQTIVTLPLVLPPVVIGYLLLYAFSPRRALGDSLEWAGMPVAFHWLGAVVAASVVGFPLFVFTIGLSMRTVDARLELISRSLGTSPWRTFWRITIPLSWPGILSGAVISFARGIGEFGATIILAGRIPGETETIPLAIYAELERPGGEGRIGMLVAAAFVICIGCVIVARLLESRQQNRMKEGA